MLKIFTPVKIQQLRPGLNPQVRTESNNSESFMKRDHAGDLNQNDKANLYLYKTGNALRAPGS